MRTDDLKLVLEGVHNHGFTDNLHRFFPDITAYVKSLKEAPNTTDDTKAVLDQVLAFLSQNEYPVDYYDWLL